MTPRGFSALKLRLVLFRVLDSKYLSLIVLYCSRWSCDVCESVVIECWSCKILSCIALPSLPIEPCNILPVVLFNSCYLFCCGYWFATYSICRWFHLSNRKCVIGNMRTAMARIAGWSQYYTCGFSQCSSRVEIRFRDVVWFLSSIYLRIEMLFWLV